MMRIMVVFFLFFSVMYSLKIYIDRVEKNIQNNSSNSYVDVVQRPHLAKF